jgi:hypothetical protein
MQDEAQLRDELESVAEQARERRSVDAFTRAAVEGFLWAVFAGVCGKLVWDSVRIPLFFYPLVVLDGVLLWDAARHFIQARSALAREVRLEARLRELRVRLGIDP